VGGNFPAGGDGFFTSGFTAKDFAANGGFTAGFAFRPAPLRQAASLSGIPFFFSKEGGIFGG